MRMSMQLALRAQAGYYVATGALPLVSMRSFEAITGKKTDTWLVRMVGLLAVSAGTTLWIGARAKKIQPETLALSLLAALSFSLIDVVYVGNRRISPIYLADTAVELACIYAVLSGYADASSRELLPPPFLRSDKDGTVSATGAPSTRKS